MNADFTCGQLPHSSRGHRGEGQALFKSLRDREAPLPLTPFTTTPISGSEVHQLINTPFYFLPQLGLSATARHQKRPAEEETVNPHPSPLPLSLRVSIQKPCPPKVDNCCGA